MKRLSVLLLAIVLGACSFSGCGKTPDTTTGGPDHQPSGAVCGDGVKDEGEECDDGNTTNGDGCSSACKIESGYQCTGGSCAAVVCGDGKVGSGEACDDGNTDDGDGCSATCQVEAGYTCPTPGAACTSLCGNGVVDAGEVCDEGPQSSHACEKCTVIKEGYECPPNGGVCKEKTCGNGREDAGEACDDGNSVGGDGCTADCSAVESGFICEGFGPTSCRLNTCGNGTLDTGEQCDDGKAANKGEYNKCRRNCTWAPRCGDGRVNAVFGETCDDGNTDDGDGCSATCTIESGWICPKGFKKQCYKDTCGDGVIQPENNEKCDDGNRVGGDGCSADCSSVEQGFICLTPGESCLARRCGDGIIAAGEECDDGNLRGGDGCSSFCKVEKGHKCDYDSSLKRSVCSLVTCGDGHLEGDEECDDGNEASNDGCTAQCKLEPGYQCPTPGQLCVTEICGNGVVAGIEQCDEGTSTPSGGCKDCQIVEGFKCENPGQPCVPIKCGDGKVEGLEQCDDGNNKGGDGCDPFCRLESLFSCKPGKGCTPTCGDGITITEGLYPEQCDDGNLNAGDGCSPECKIEKGYVCTDFKSKALPSQIKLKAIIRDFKAYNNGQGHPDFERGTTWRAYTCHSGQEEAGNEGEGKGLLEKVLDRDGLPVLRKGNDPSRKGGACFGGQGFHGIKGVTDSAKQDENYKKAKKAFDQFYRTVDNVNKEITTEITLKQEGGRNSDKYIFKSDDFFPIDGKGWGNEDQNRNYHFTTEVRTYFKYKGGETLTFNGDDDLWVFINGQLALDMGGVKQATEGSFTLGSTVDPISGQKHDPIFNIYEGGIYEIAIFHAERQTRKSVFHLTLTGFVNTGTSECVPECGDGVFTFVPGVEMCDDGNKKDGDGCSATCEIEPGYFCTNEQGKASKCEKTTCGDGIRQYPEQCDDGNTDDGDGCSSSCRHDNCGDGNLNTPTSAVKGYEECDAGAQNGQPGSNCTVDCTIPKCGDFIVQDNEECDDGNTINTDYCTNACKFPVCGDSIVQDILGEQCDDGVNDGSYNSCLPDCTERSAYCGDGLIQASAGEECDDGTENGQVGYGRCTADCKVSSYCGDGVRQRPEEECDDGNDDPNDGCDQCNISPNFFCVEDAKGKSTCQSLG